MWWIKGNREPDRGGFQDRDVGRITYNREMGPEFGVDYALFALPPDPAADRELRLRVEEELLPQLEALQARVDFSVRNGFVIVTGSILNDESRMELLDRVRGVDGVREVINQVKFIQ